MHVLQTRVDFEIPFLNTILVTRVKEQHCETKVGSKIGHNSDSFVSFWTIDRPPNRQTRHFHLHKDNLQGPTG
jgi:hypothetical protein